MAETITPWYKQYLHIILLLFVAVLIRIVAGNPAWVEQYYSTGLYPPLAMFMRQLLGWLPFSFGDLLYTIVGLLLVYTVIRTIWLLVKRRLGKQHLANATIRLLLVTLVVYIYFNLAWGLNYNRLGIAHQLQIQTNGYSVADLQGITSILIHKLNGSRAVFPDSIIAIASPSQVFDESKAAYHNLSGTYPWLTYDAQSVKRSLYGKMGKYLGFSGYYNPFTGEAQLNLTIPRFILPIITCHEMGHQLGYASESEASFVGYLAATHSGDSLYAYSAYFDLFSYANRELAIRDSVSAKNNMNKLTRRVKGDFVQLRDYLNKSRNPFEPLVKIFYDHYLKINQQEKGMESYNQVVGWLIAYQKKFGTI